MFTARCLRSKTQEIVFEAGTLLDESKVETLEVLGVHEVFVRSAITCETRYGLCAACYGRDLARGHLVNIGEAVGVIAAQSIGEPGTQLTMRTFHIGGAHLNNYSNNIQVKSSGRVKLHNMKLLERINGKFVAVSRSGEVTVLDENGRERERYKVPYGAVFTVADNDAIQAGQIVASWDPHMHPIITEVAGSVRFVDMIEGITMQKQTDEVTGLTNIVITDAKQRSSSGKELRAMVKLVDAAGEDVCLGGTTHPAYYFLPSDAIVNLNDGAPVGVGDVIATYAARIIKNTGYHRGSATRCRFI